MTDYKNRISTKLIFSTVILMVGAFLFIEFNRETKNGISNTERPAVEINGRVIGVEIADSFEKQRQGLSDREELTQGTGMLFVWDNKQVRTFWMKNMYFPLDIIWITDGQVVNISENLPPEGEVPKNTYSSIFPVDYVLEVNAGFCQRYGIKVGDEVFLNL